MAINPPSDIVLDVARAADPEKYRAAVERLARLRAVAPASEVFMPSTAGARAATTQNTPATETVAASAGHAGAPARGRPRLDPYGQFEAFVLQSFLESMLPKDATTVFGSGSAGEFWRSMLAEKLGGELARSGQIGIAQRLAKGPSHPSQPSTMDTSPGAAHPTLAPAHMSQPAPDTSGALTEQEASVPPAAIKRS